MFAASGLLEVGPSDRIRAVDVRDGSVRWSFSTTDGQPLYNGAVGDGAIYISSNSGSVYRLDEATGDATQGWPFHTGGEVGYLASLVDGVLYVPGADPFIYDSRAIAVLPCLAGVDIDRHTNQLFEFASCPL